MATASTKGATPAEVVRVAPAEAGQLLFELNDDGPDRA